jgi:hypothetical protein
MYLMRNDIPIPFPQDCLPTENRGLIFSIDLDLVVYTFQDNWFGFLNKKHINSFKREFHQHCTRFISLGYIANIVICQRDAM